MVNQTMKVLLFENDFAALKQEEIAFEENKNETFKANPEEEFSSSLFS
jgi:UDPglucose--hexose-1-phosphate uridylyltransferase